MLRALVILDRQHGDKGAGFDVGAVAPGLREVDLSTSYGLVAAENLRLLGIDVLWIDTGPYLVRHFEAIEAARSTEAPALYCALHVNAGGGRAGIVFHDARSSRGARAARAIAARFGESLPELSTSSTIPARPQDWSVNAWHTIRRLYDGPSTISGVCIEPGFIDCPKHSELWTATGLQRIGLALADGIADFLLAESS